MLTRRLLENEIADAINLAHRNFLEVNIKDYSKEAMDNLVASYNEERIRKTLESGHVYAVLDDEKIIGTGAITPFNGSEKVSILLSIFVMPEYHGRGIGKIIMNALEQDEIYLNSEKVVLHASITAATFYEKLGYSYKDNEKKLQPGDYYKMEKLRN